MDEPKKRKEPGKKINTNSSMRNSFVEDKKLRQIDYLIQSMNNSHDEILFRIKSRDNWLRLQLLTQTVLLAIALGVNFIGISITQNLPWIIFLSIPTSLLYVLLYILEDNIIISLNEYVLSIPDSIKSIGGFLVDIADLMIYKQGYIAKKSNLITDSRVKVSQLTISIIVFFLIPLTISIFYLPNLIESQIKSVMKIMIFAVEVIILFFILYIIIENYKQKKA